MAFQSCPDIAEVVVLGDSAGKTIVNVLHARKTGGYGATDVQNLAVAVSAVTHAQYPGLVSGDIQIAGVRVKGLANLNDFEFVTNPTPAPGSVGTTPLPANNSLVITLRSAVTGRSARGRLYSFPTGSDNLDTPANTYLATYAAALVSMWEDVAVAIATEGWDHVILSRFTGGAQRALGVGFVVTQILARNLSADSQRGRLPKGH